MFLISKNTIVYLTQERGGIQFLIFKNTIIDI